ncbi:MAG: replicative DNA helicase [Gammaproteobacteria bacterium]|nr:replicative DNA helicase [Gammaproteobacteria bacterium]
MSESSASLGRVATLPNAANENSAKLPRKNNKKNATEISPDATRELRVPPHSLQMEQAVLAALMTISESWEQVSEIITENSFYAIRHRLIYKAIGHLAAANMPYDAVMVSDWLGGQHLLEDSGGEAYLMQLLAESPASLFNLPAYAEKVREHAVLRDLIAVGNDVLHTAYDAKGQPVSEILDSVESKVFAISEQHNNRTAESGPKAINNVLKSVLNTVEELQGSDSAITGLTTGFIELDNKTLGMQKGDLIIVAARPSMGKTTFAMNLVESVLFGSNLPALVFSMEMPADSIAVRLLSSFGSIDQGRLRSGRLEEGDWIRLTSTMGQLQDKHLYIDDSSALPPNEVRARARRIAKMHNGSLGVIMIDYLQLMKVPGMGDNRVGEISEISRSLKALAKEMNCPVIALSQLNRSLENRPNKRPIMSDLRESGAIEQDADLIMFIYRDEVYNKESKEMGTAEIIIGKQRNGPIGTVRLAFQGQFTRFTNLSPEFYRPEDDE